MADLLKQGSDWLQSMRNQHATQSVIYKRGSDQVTLNATKGKSQIEVEDEYGTRIETEITDFLITASDLVLNGQTTTPAVGDKIEETIDGVTRIYEVMPIVAEGHWRWSDSFGKTLRIHTRLIDDGV